MKLLYAEDERPLSEAVVDILTYHKYLVDAVYNGKDAYDYAVSGSYDGIILDIMMPGRDGIDILAALRKKGCKTPILLLTAKTQIDDRIRGLDAGADDYLPKPFDMGELLARVRAMLRRREEFHPDLLSFGDLTLNIHRTGRHSVLRRHRIYTAQAGISPDGAVNGKLQYLSVLGGLAGQGLGI